jgi:O-antigen/teichoic acid export membrane protein
VRVLERLPGTAGAHALRTLGWELPLFGAATFVDQGGRLLLNVIAAAVLGPAVFGSWVLAALLIQYSNFVSLGITNGAARQIPFLLGADRPAEAARVEDVALLTAGFTGLMAAGVGLGSAPLVFGPQPGFGGFGLACLAAAIFLQQFFLLQQVLFRSRLRFRHASLQLGLTGLAAPLVGGLLVVAAGLDGLLAARVVIICLALALATRLLARLPRPRWHGPTARELIRVGLPIMTASLLFGLLVTIDRWLVLTLMGRVAVGQYGLVAVAISGLLVLPIFVSQQFYPRLAYAHGAARDREELLHICRQQGVLAASMTAAAAVAVALAAWFGIPVFLPEYRAAIVPIVIVLAGLVAYAAGSPYGSLLNVLGRQHRFLTLQAAALAMNVTLAVALVRVAGLGLEGVALASLFSLAVYGSLLQLVALRSTRDMAAGTPAAAASEGLDVPAAP